MHKNLEFCTLDTHVPEIKDLMQKYDYKEVVVLNAEHVPVGVVTMDAVSDEALEEYDFPFSLTAAERMKPIEVVVTKDTSTEECLKLMEANYRTILPVVDDQGLYCGIVKKSDILKQ